MSRINAPSGHVRAYIPRPHGRGFTPALGKGIGAAAVPVVAGLLLALAPAGSANAFTIVDGGSASKSGSTAFVPWSLVRASGPTTADVRLAIPPDFFSPSGEFRSSSSFYFTYAPMAQGIGSTATKTVWVNAMGKTTITGLKPGTQYVWRATAKAVVGSYQAVDSYTETGMFATPLS